MLASILLGSYRRRALGLLLLHPEMSYHVREISRLTGTSVGTLHKELTKLAQAGLLLRKEIGNQVHYAANTECPIFLELQGLLRKTSGVVDVLREGLDEISERIAVSLVFGSVAKGEERAGSDVDVLVIGSVSFVEVVKALHPAQSMLQREVNPVVYTSDEFRHKLASDDAFLRGIVDGEKLFLIGNEHDLAKFARHTQAGST